MIMILNSNNTRRGGLEAVGMVIIIMGRQGLVPGQLTARDLTLADLV